MQQIHRAFEKGDTKIKALLLSDGSRNTEEGVAVCVRIARAKFFAPPNFGIELKSIIIIKL